MRHQLGLVLSFSLLISSSCFAGGGSSQSEYERRLLLQYEKRLADSRAESARNSVILEALGKRRDIQVSRAMDRFLNLPAGSFRGTDEMNYGTRSIETVNGSVACIYGTSAINCLSSDGDKVRAISDQALQAIIARTK